MPKSAKIFRMRRAKNHQIFVFLYLQIPQIFACGGPKTHIFNIFMHLDTQNFRLRRAKNLHIPCLKCFLEYRRAPLSFAKLNLKQICANHIVFTVTGTHFYHSQNKTGAARAQFLFVLRVQERATIIRDTKQEPPIVQARYWNFTGVRTCRCQSQNDL